MRGYLKGCEDFIKQAIICHGLHRVVGDPESTVGMQAYEVKEVLAQSSEIKKFLADLGYSNNNGYWKLNSTAETTPIETPPLK